MPNILKVFGSK